MNASRRLFLRAGSGLVAAAASPLGQRFNASMALGLSGLGAMAAQRASAADGSGYKALVCLFLAGGSDHHNWVVPIDASGYAEYAKARQELAWPLSRLLPITSNTQGSGRAFGMPEELQPLQALYEAGQCAVVANVGTLERPTTRADYQADRGLPSKLFSHNDQQSTWQSLSPEGARSGWGARMGDVLAAANQYPVFTAVSAAGNAVFLAGGQVSQYQVSPSGPVAVSALEGGPILGSSTANSAVRRVLGSSGSNAYLGEYARMMQRSIDTTTTLQSALARHNIGALPSTPIKLPGGNTLMLDKDSLARQLHVVARMIATAPALGMRRQVFMVQLGGFDSHNDQMRDQPALMARVAHSVHWFFNAMSGAGLANAVTLFTASDFGRTLVSNGDGSDHGWGNHHLVVGGAVKGRTIHGRFPVTALGGHNDVGSGRLLPSMAVTQLASSLAGWMGLNAGEQLTALPNLGNFDNGPALF
jgi:uncharacterized protein (DUF1501 family)